jgi:TRAP-type C4-dicarboxylate transport system substrate-binding protein
LCVTVWLCFGLHSAAHTATTTTAAAHAAATATAAHTAATAAATATATTTHGEPPVKVTNNDDQLQVRGYECIDSTRN